MFLCMLCTHSMSHSDMPTRGVRGHAPLENFLILLTPQMQFPAFWADFKSSLYVKFIVREILVREVCGAYTDRHHFCWICFSSSDLRSNHEAKYLEIPFNSFDTSKAACHVRAMLRSRTYYYKSYLSRTVVISVCPYYKDFLVFF